MDRYQHLQCLRRKTVSYRGSCLFSKSGLTPFDRFGGCCFPLKTTCTNYSIFSIKHYSALKTCWTFLSSEPVYAWLKIINLRLCPVTDALLGWGIINVKRTSIEWRGGFVADTMIADNFTVAFLPFGLECVEMWVSSVFRAMHGKIIDEIMVKLCKSL